MSEVVHGIVNSWLYASLGVDLELSLPLWCRGCGAIIVHNCIYIRGIPYLNSSLSLLDYLIAMYHRTIAFQLIGRVTKGFPQSIVARNQLNPKKILFGGIRKNVSKLGYCGR